MKKSFFMLGLISIVLTTFGQSKINETLIKRLDSVLVDDQIYRDQLDSIRSKYASDSIGLKVQLSRQWRIIREKDSINSIKVSEIIDRYGWLGSDIIGTSGNSTLFLVVQHSDLQTQEKYLPIMREAVKKGNAKAGSLALLEDRVALKHGKRQIYGSQVAWNMLNNTYYVVPLNDPYNVDKRRKEVGLSPIAEYLSNWKMTWNSKQYKKDLLWIEALHKARAQ